MNIQTICRILGENGCYFLCLLHVAKADYMALSLYQLAVEKKYMDADCYVKNPAALLHLAAGGNWSVSYASTDTLPKENEQEILRFERKTTGTTYAHFVVGDGQGGIAYDPLDTSRTVAEGMLVSKRIVRRI